MFMWDKLCVRTETFLAVKYVTLGCSVILPKGARYKHLGTSNNLTGEIFKICSKPSSAFAVGNNFSRLPTDEMLDTMVKTESISISRMSVFNCTRYFIKCVIIFTAENK